MTRRLLLAGAVLVVSAAVVVLGALLDRATVATASGLAVLRFGGPLAWLSQDQSGLDPPLPDEARLASPWEHPTSVAWLPFVAEVAIVAVVVALACGVVARVHARRSPAATVLAPA